MKILRTEKQRSRFVGITFYSTAFLSIFLISKLMALVLMCIFAFMFGVDRISTLIENWISKGEKE